MFLHSSCTFSQELPRKYSFIISLDIMAFSTLGTRGNSLAKSGRPKAGETSVRSEVSEVSEGPNASSLWWRTPTVSLCLIQILYLITDWLFKNVFLPATAVGQKRLCEMNRFFQQDRMVSCGEEMSTAKGFY